ncbi:MAG: amidohydrolase family protein, partial [Candidatus Cloacimonadales bacterium]|nr:amidohydrolase family protein [Candidatus Cloacimonadales bacterium]
MFKIKVKQSIQSLDEVRNNHWVEIDSAFFKSGEYQWDNNSLLKSIPLINSHDHLVGNWYPKSGTNAPYLNSHQWVEDNKISASMAERNKIWENSGKFDLMEKNAPLLVKLGAFKNLFSGVSIVQDHGVQQDPAYYEMFPIEVVKDYAQCHSITLGNWWGGDTPEEEMKKSKGRMPFIIHLAEGLDDETKNEFTLLKKAGLLKQNTLIIHGIALTRSELDDIKAVGASVCWCPNSNNYLIGQTLDIMSCFEKGVNVVLGTDSSMTGSINMLEEIRYAKKEFPIITAKQLYQMVTTNAYRALYVNDAELLDPRKNLLIISKKKEDPFENILYQEIDDVHLMVQKGVPLYGDISFMDHLNVDEKDYYFFKVGNKEKFVV